MAVFLESTPPGLKGPTPGPSVIAPAAGEEIGIGQPNTLLERGFRVPAEFGELRDIHQLARGAVRFRLVMVDRAFEAHDRRDEARQFRDGRISLAPSHR